MPLMVLMFNFPCSYPLEQTLSHPRLQPHRRHRRVSYEPIWDEKTVCSCRCLILALSLTSPKENLSSTIPVLVKVGRKKEALIRQEMAIKILEAKIGGLMVQNPIGAEVIRGVLLEVEEEVAEVKEHIIKVDKTMVSQRIVVEVTEARIVVEVTEARIVVEVKVIPEAITKQEVKVIEEVVAI